MGVWGFRLEGLGLKSVGVPFRLFGSGFFGLIRV